MDISISIDSFPPAQHSLLGEGDRGADDHPPWPHEAQSPLASFYSPQFS
jgi:hypothetical protein